MKTENNETIGLPVKVKKLVESAVIPQYAHDTDAGLDLTAVSKEFDEYGNYVYHTGLAFEIPEGYVGLIFPRSSISKHNLSLCNCVGVIDSAYRGEVLFKFNEAIDYTLSTPKFGQFGVIKTKDVYKVGDRIGQLIIMPYPKVTLIETDDLSDSDRGEDGFGSTGN